MTQAIAHSLVDRFYKVYAVRDIDKVAEFLDDDVEWAISGPVEYLRFCGTHRGKDNVIDMLRNQIPAVLRTFSFVPESILVDGNQLAMLHRQSSRRTVDNRVINFRVANFIRFRNDKVVQNLSLLDSFDAVEQVMGHRIEFSAAGRRVADTGDLAVI
jgi:ketosteroid isomerase-like protein